MAGKDGGSPQRLQSQEKPSVWQGFGEPDLSLLDRSELMGALEEAFKSLHSGRAVQPPQTLSVFPEGRGDFIAYLGVIENLGVFGVKVSPYMPELTPSVTAWTLLMGMETGAPLLLASSRDSPSTGPRPPRPWR